MGSELNGQGKAQFHCRDCSDLAKTISPAMNLRVIKSLATPSCSLVFAPAMGISTSSDRKSGNQQRTTAINHHHLNIHHREPFYQPSSSSDFNHPLPEAYSNITSPPNLLQHLL